MTLYRLMLKLLTMVLDSMQPDNDPDFVSPIKIHIPVRLRCGHGEIPLNDFSIRLERMYSDPNEPYVIVLEPVQQSGIGSSLDV